MTRTSQTCAPPGADGRRPAVPPYGRGGPPFITALVAALALASCAGPALVMPRYTGSLWQPRNAITSIGNSTVSAVEHVTGAK
jgi:hypothetical protein